MEHDLIRIDAETGEREHYARLQSEESAIRALYLAERYDDEAHSEFVVRPAKQPTQDMTRSAIRRDQRRCLWQQSRGRSWTEAMAFEKTPHWVRTAWRL
jgi:hypothetical protein